MPYWKCYYHIVWGTKNRQPIIKSEHESVIHAIIDKKANLLKSHVLGINGTSDHLHIAMAIHPSNNLAQLIGQLKGISSREVNQSFILETPFQWQESYGVLTFSEREMPIILNYITHQKEHHATGKIWHEFEEVTE